MPHDTKGRLIEVGDVVESRPYNQENGEDRRYVGPVVDIHNDAQSCTGQMKYFYLGKGKKSDTKVWRHNQDYFGADESTLIMKADGSLPKEA